MNCAATGILGAGLCAVAWGCTRIVTPAGVTVLRPVARVETTPVASPKDAADDPAIWIHSEVPQRSVVFGTNKEGGLETYALDGRRLASISNELAPDNVDIAYGVDFGGGVRKDIVAGSVCGAEKGFMIWSIDAQTGLPSAELAHPIAVFDGKVPYGSALYHRARDGALFFFVNDRRGRVEQYELKGANGSLNAKRVRQFELGGTTEGCVADDELGLFYISEEDRAIWCLGADPEDPCGAKDRRAIDTIGGTSGAVPDFEGLSIYYGSEGRGYVIASVQGANRFHVYDRVGDHALLAIVDPAASAAIGDVEESDGIAVESFALAPPFERGLFVVQDGLNAPNTQNFKLYAWEDVAGKHLAIDASSNPRQRVWRKR